MTSVHVADLARAYMVLLELLEHSSPATVRQNPYVFADGTQGDPVFRDVSRVAAGNLYDIGRIDEAEPRSWTESEYDDVMGPDITPRGLGCNSRSRSVRLRQAGWSPREGTLETAWKKEARSIVAELDAASAQ